MAVSVMVRCARVILAPIGRAPPQTIHPPSMVKRAQMAAKSRCAALTITQSTRTGAGEDNGIDIGSQWVQTPRHGDPIRVRVEIMGLIRIRTY
jgi:hypothetical protein